jgi:TonB family protein
MSNVILMGLLFAMAIPSGAVSKDRDRPVDPPPCSPEMRQAIDRMKAQKSRADIAPPVPLVSPEADIPDSARKQLRKKHTLFAESILGFTVDEEGNPRDVCLIQPAGFGLDASAANAAKGYKFKPARDHGNPIAYPITLQVTFRLY